MYYVAAYLQLFNILGVLFTYSTKKEEPTLGVPAFSSTAHVSVSVQQRSCSARRSRGGLASPGAPPASCQSSAASRFENIYTLLSITNKLTHLFES